jgi:hypothetical protein
MIYLKIIRCISLCVLINLSLDISESKATTCRSISVKHKFDLASGFPHGRKGYVVDHIAPLVCGGRDIISNMQYQTIKEGKLKDRWESTPTGCKILCKVIECTSTRQVFNCR